MATDFDVKVDVKQQYVKYDNDSSLETSSSEDEDGEEITEQFEKDWMCTLAALKTKDPKIYDKNVKFFQYTDKSSAEKKAKKKKTLSLQDVQRKTLITTEGAPPGDEKIRFEEDVDIPVVPSYYEEQQRLKRQFQEAASSIPDQGEDILVRKSSENIESEKEEDYRLFLKGKSNKLKKSNKISHELSVMKDFWSKGDLDEGEIFLRDYILNKGYKTNNLIPSYKDIIKDEEFSEDEDTLNRQDNFEREYNFRFEEPDRNFIKSHPRKIIDSVRIENNTRAEKRKATLERKKKEKEMKQEKLKSLKKQKRKEIIEKITKLKEVSGNDSFEIKDIDLDEDFNPEQYDQFMKDAFCEEYYLKGADDAEKPVFSDDDWEVDKNCDMNEEPGCSYQADNLHFEDPGFNMDADYVPTQHKSKNPRRDKKKKQKQEKPKFNPDEMTFEEYFDEYYKLDYEDLIDDLPCRYQYRPVATNDFGLDTDEILRSTDKELNTWCPLSKVVQYRTEEEEFVNRKMYLKRSRQKNRKMNILTTYYSHSKSSSSSKTSNNQQDNEEEVKERKTHNIKSDLQSNSEVSSVNSKQHNNSKSKKQKMLIDESLLERNMESTRSKENTVNKSKKKLMYKDNSSSTAGALTKSKSSKGFKNKTEDEGNVAKVFELSNTKLKKKKRAERWKQKQKGIKHNEQLNITLSNARLKAYGINPKKFKYIQLPEQKSK